MALNDIANVNQTSSYYATDTNNGLKPDAHYDRVLLEMIRLKDFKHMKYGKKKPMPRKFGDTINFRRFNSLAVNTTPLVEGTPPSPDQASASSITATTAQYGRYMEFTDVVDFQVIDPVIEEYTVELGHLAAETMDVLVRDAILAEGSAYYSSAQATRTDLADMVAGDVPNITDFRKITLSMKRQLVRPAQGGNYIALVSPSVMFDLIDDPTVQKYMEFGSHTKPMKDNKVVSLFGISFVEVMNCLEDNTGVTSTDVVHRSIVLGNEAFGVTTIKGEGDAKTYVKPLGSAGTLDPINQRQSIGFKINAFGAKVIRSEAAVVYYSVPTNQ